MEEAIEGFICPECAFSAETMEDLLVHFEGHINNRLSSDKSVVDSDDSGHPPVQTDIDNADGNNENVVEEIDWVGAVFSSLWVF